MRSLTVKYTDDGRIKVIPEDRKWKVRVHGDEEVDFNIVKKGDQVVAYWTPNKRFYEAVVVGIPGNGPFISEWLLSFFDSCSLFVHSFTENSKGGNRVKRQLDLDRDVRK